MTHKKLADIQYARIVLTKIDFQMFKSDRLLIQHLKSFDILYTS